MSYIVTYDLRAPGRNYDSLYEALRSYGTYYHIQESVWIIVSNRSATEICDHLLTFIDSNDSLFVARLSGEAAWFGVPDSDWLKRNL